MFNVLFVITDDQDHTIQRLSLQGPTDIMTELMTAISHISSSPGRLEQSSQNLEGVLNSSLKDNETLQVTKLL